MLYVTNISPYIAFLWNSLNTEDRIFLLLCKLQQRDL
jgi:hypothetical protein